MEAIQLNRAQTSSTEAYKTGRALLSMKEDMCWLRTLIRNALAVARYNRPLRAYAWLA